MLRFLVPAVLFAAIAMASPAAAGAVTVAAGPDGRALITEKRLTTNASFGDVAAAIDEAGNATIAFGRKDGASSDRPAELVAVRARPGERFGSPAVVGRGGPPVMGAGFAVIRLAAAGTTTALTWDPNDSGDPKHSDGRHGVAIAHSAGRFGRAQRPSAAPLGPSGIHGWPLAPVVAVDRAGDVLFAYSYGIYGTAVHVAERRSRSARFSAPRVVSTLGHGGGPTVALLSDRTPLVIWTDSGGQLHSTLRLAGPLVDQTPPRATVTLAPRTEAQLRKHNALRVTIGCSEACIVQAHAHLRTKTGRAFASAEATLRRAGSAVTKRFAFDPTRWAGRARTGSRLRVTVNVENASGASTEVVRQITLGRGH
jgi:hypothetical protein